MHPGTWLLRLLRALGVIPMSSIPSPAKSILQTQLPILLLVVVDMQVVEATFDVTVLH
jgi:hypothetical protein